MVQAPEHVIENVKAMAKATAKFGDDAEEAAPGGQEEAAGGLRVSWGEPTFNRLVESVPDPLTSSFTVTHAMLHEPDGTPRRSRSRPPAGCSPKTTSRASSQLRLMKKALGIYRELLAAGVVERIPPEEQGPDGRTVRLTVHLQANFALNQPLSPFALAALELLDPESPSYALDVVSVIEATLEKPRQILSAQQKKARGEADRGDEGRRASSTTSGWRCSRRSPTRSRSRRSSARPSRSTARPRRGWATSSSRPSRWSGTCTSAP